MTDTQKASDEQIALLRLREAPIEDLREAFSYNPETGSITWAKYCGGPVKVGSEPRFVNSEGYRSVGFKGRSYKSHRLAWAIFYGEWPSMRIDHINGDPSDNRIANLRIATQSQNLCNRPSPKVGIAGLKGVTPCGQKYQAQIMKDGKKHYLGVFATPEEAHAAYALAAIRLHGEFANTAGAAMPAAPAGEKGE